MTAHNEDHAEIEMATLACMVSSPRMAPKVAEMLHAPDFTSRSRRAIYSIMSEMLDDGERIDDLTLMAALRTDYPDDQEILATAAQLRQVAASLASCENAMEYAAVVRDEAVRASIVRDTERAISTPAEVEETLERIESVAYSARSRLLGEGASRELDQTSVLGPLSAFLSAPQKESGFPYPLPSMRAEYGTYERNRYSILAGYSGDGKTTMAFQWVEEMCEAGARACVYEMEMSGLQTSRMLALQAGAITPKQAKGIDSLSAEDHARLAQLEKYIAKHWNLSVITGPVLPSQMRADQMRERYDVILADHMGKFERTKEGEYNDLTRYSGQLHRITRDLDCSVIALMQLKMPKVDQRTGVAMFPEPSTGSIRGSYAPIEDADDVLFIHRNRAGGLRTNDGAGSLIIGKMRDGQPDRRVPVWLHPERIRYYEVDERPKAELRFIRKVSEVTA